jgi:predicted transcriptional regulator of viral defense system
VNNVPEYLQHFHEHLKERFSGSLVKVKTVEEIEPNAKEYLNKLAKAGLVERVRWGWYWIPAEIKDIWDFLEKDRNFKVVSAQTAASLWNYDFVHRDVYLLKVTDRSYGEALEAFAERRDWKVRTEYVDKSDADYEKVDGLFVESVGKTVIECLQDWAFTDAFAALYSNRERVRLKRLSKEAYWKRISGSHVRVRQALEYGCHLVNELTGQRIFDVKEPQLEDEYVKREIEEAVEKVVSLA